MNNSPVPYVHASAIQAIASVLVSLVETTEHCYRVVVKRYLLLQHSSSASSHSLSVACYSVLVSPSL